MGEKNPKQPTEQIKNKNTACLSGITAVRVLSLAWNHSPPHRLRISFIIVLISGPAVGESHILTSSYSYVFLPPMPTAIRTSVFSFVGASIGFEFFLLVSALLRLV